MLSQTTEIDLAQEDKSCIKKNKEKEQVIGPLWEIYGKEEKISANLNWTLLYRLSRVFLTFLQDKKYFSLANSSY